jgi:hypothetical protein
MLVMSRQFLIMRLTSRQPGQSSIFESSSDIHGEQPLCGPPRASGRFSKPCWRLYHDVLIPTYRPSPASLGITGAE